MQIIKADIILLYKRKSSETWMYSIDNDYCVEVFETEGEAKTAAFEELERMNNGICGKEGPL